MRMVKCQIFFLFFVFESHDAFFFLSHDHWRIIGSQGYIESPSLSLFVKSHTHTHTQFVDKASFFFGVNTVLLTEMVLLTDPDKLWIVFIVLCPVLICIRLPLYYIEKFHFFTIDFCYFVNALYFLCIATHALVGSQAVLSKFQEYYYVDSSTLSSLNSCLLRVLFANTTGPLLCAIWVWRNSAVFHSLDKMTSLFIHIIPALLSFAQRWYTNGTVKNDDSSTIVMRFVMCNDDCKLSMMEWFGWPLVSYVTWQFLYLFITECACRRTLERDQDIQTSMRWLSADRKNGFNKFCKKICRKLGILGPKEEFNGSSFSSFLSFFSPSFISHNATIRRYRKNENHICDTTIYIHHPHIHPRQILLRILYFSCHISSRDYT